MMTVEQIEQSSADEIREYINSFALTADLSNPEHVEILHAAKSKFMGVWAQKVLREERS